MTPIETNKPVFFDVDASPLNDGEIYIGQPGTDPRTNAKTVTFRDAGGSEFTAQQPLRTNNGRIVYNGKPIVALVDGEYSMLVFNSSGEQVDYAQSVNSEAAAEIDLSETIRVGLTLADIKAFDVAVADTVENVGKVSATDDLGGRWLAISATGTSGDDVNLIDFNNGLQGQRIREEQTPRLVWSGSANFVPIADLDEGGAGFYWITAASIGRALIYVDPSKTLTQVGMANAQVGPSNYITLYSVEFGGSVSPSFRAWERTLNHDTASTSEGELPISEIYKV